MFGITRNKQEQTLKVVLDGGEPVSVYIPIIQDERKLLYKKFLDKGITLPNYELFESVPDINVEDLQVLAEDYSLDIEYGDNVYCFLFRAGFCFDGASVPLLFRFGWVANNSQYTLNASMVHDVLYTLNFLPKKDCDNFFEGVMRHNRLNEFWIFIYIAGLAIGGGKKYNELSVRYSDKSKYWGTEFINISVYPKR